MHELGYGTATESPRVEPVSSPSFLLGIASLVFFTVSFLPQLFKNYQRRSVDGLSRWLLITWFLGDLSNFIGSILTHQLPTQISIGVCFLVLESFLLVQYILFSRNDAIRYAELCEEEVPIAEEGSEAESSPSTLRSSSPRKPVLSPHIIVAITLISLISGVVSHPAYPLNSLSSKDDSFFERVVGPLSAWTSGLLYFTSRIPQIRTNSQLKSVHGLSASTFVLTLLANITYALSILVDPDFVVNTDFWGGTFPYLLGSLGTVIWDIVILIQVGIYGSNPPQDRLDTVDGRDTEEA